METFFSSVPSAVLCVFSLLHFHTDFGKKKIKIIKLGKVLTFSVRMTSGFFVSSL